MNKLWSGKILDLDEDIKKLKSKIKGILFKDIKKDKLSPLEFTILENIAYNQKALSGYDLIKKLNEHFAGTWKARSGTIYPILYRLKKNGFLMTEEVKSPIGPIKKVYSLTDAGKAILEHKINKNFIDQINFIENFLIELCSLYVLASSEKERQSRIDVVKETIKNTLQKIIKKVNSCVKKDSTKLKCPNCNEEYPRDDEINFCPKCGREL
ncbi:MAG: hypothetical protein GF329_11270 [Candidatus Lokiarchaeota archaeon]|nr:hypothetical protein [Candidatus Lokiarchaeota archaeon]